MLTAYKFLLSWMVFSLWPPCTFMYACYGHGRMNRGEARIAVDRVVAADDGCHVGVHESTRRCVDGRQCAGGPRRQRGAEGWQATLYWRGEGGCGNVSSSGMIQHPREERPWWLRHLQRAQLAHRGVVWHHLRGSDQQIEQTALYVRDGRVRIVGMPQRHIDQLRVRDVGSDAASTSSRQHSCRHFYASNTSAAHHFAPAGLYIWEWIHRLYLVYLSIYHNFQYNIM